MKIMSLVYTPFERLSAPAGEQGGVVAPEYRRQDDYDDDYEDDDYDDEEEPFHPGDIPDEEKTPVRDRTGRETARTTERRNTYALLGI